jgi:hypothetical protein
MGAVSFVEVLMMAILSGGSGSTDLVAMMQPRQYFESRQIEPSIDKMMDLASDDPKNAKTQIVQLNALRFLADESDNPKKSANYAAYRQQLEAIAKGTKAQDAQGFAKDYANRVLQKLDGTKDTPVKVRPIREEALGWFPANATIAGAIDLRQGSQPAAGGADPIKELLKMLPDRERTQMYDFIEKSGNVRIERLAFALVDNPEQKDQSKIFVRFTGKGNQAWLVETFREMFRELSGGRMQTSESKADDGTPITLLQTPNQPPAIMMVGDTDILMVGYMGNNGKHDDLVAEVLDARSKKTANATSGVLKTLLTKIPDKAVGLLVGTTPEQMKRELGPVFDPLPAKIAMFVEKAPQGLDLQIEGTMANAEDAGRLVQKIGGLRKDGIAALQQAMQQPLPAGAPPIPFQGMISMLENLQVQNQGDAVNVRAVAPNGLLQMFPMFFMTRAVQVK